MGTRLTLSATPGRNYGSFVRIVILLIPSRMFTATARKRTYTAESRLRAYTATARKRTYTATR